MYSTSPYTPSFSLFLLPFLPFDNDSNIINKPKHGGTKRGAFHFLLVLKLEPLILATEVRSISLLHRQLHTASSLLYSISTLFVFLFAVLSLACISDQFLASDSLNQSTSCVFVINFGAVYFAAIDFLINLLAGTIIYLLNKDISVEETRRLNRASIKATSLVNVSVQSGTDYFQTLQ